MTDWLSLHYELGRIVCQGSEVTRHPPPHVEVYNAFFFSWIVSVYRPFEFHRTHFVAVQGLPFTVWMPASSPTVVVPSAPIPDYDEEACALFTKHEGQYVGPAIASLARVTTVTMPVLQNIGLSLKCGMAFSECTSGAEKATLRTELVAALINEDKKRIVNHYGKDRPAGTDKGAAAALALSRHLTEFVLTLPAPEAPAATGLASPGVLQVVSTKPEDVHDTLQSYGPDKLKAQLLVALGMFNCRYRPHQLARHNTVKKIAHYVLVEGTFPDPERLRLDTLQRRPGDLSLALFNRLLRTVAVVAAGEAVKTGVRDDGAGEVAKHPAQWGSMNSIDDLIGELDEERDNCTEAELKAVVGVLYMTLYKATAIGKSSLSLACEQLLAGEIHKIVAGQKASATKPGGRKRGGADGDAPPLPTPKKTKKEKKADRDRAAATPPKVKGAGDGPHKTPNGLERLVGGNPQGKPCRDFFDKGKCPYGSCSFSHTKGE